MKKILKYCIILEILLATAFILPASADNSSIDQQLYQTALPYIKYFSDRALDQTSGFEGLTRSFQLYLGGHGADAEALINYGASSYDQAILGRICLSNGITTILDTYIDYYRQLSDPNNPLINSNGNYYDTSGTPINYGPYRIVRILGRDISNWWNTWDWIVDTGAAACLIVYASEAYQKTSNADYKNLAILFGDYILKLQDTDGGIRYGPRGMYHDPEPQSDFYWKLKSTEQNERALYAFEALYQITNDNKYNVAASSIKSWLKTMYDKPVHLYHSSATFNGSVWEKRGFDYVATDVMAFAPLEMMFQDSYFGTTQAQRDAEVDAMFDTIESRAAFLNTEAKPVFWRFSVSQTGDYGSVEVSSQMALAYLRAAQLYSERSQTEKVKNYLDKYNILVSSLANYFTIPSGDSNSRVAPYASYLNGNVAGGVPTGTGYYTYNCQAALASSYYAFAKAGYNPCKIGGGTGIPQTSYTLNLNVTWYQSASPYNSTAAAACKMVLNYIREGAGEPLLTQNQIYEYARYPNPFGPDLKPDEIDKALGHFDPYDYLVSNWADRYDSYPDGNPYQGYNFTVDGYDPNSNPDAINEYIRDICHWMAYTVTKEDWWLDGELVARPNTPCIVPLYGTYNHWVVIKGYAASENPCPEPHTNPYNMPNFTVYGFWIKDPLIDGIGKDTYKTSSECQENYFLPLSTADNYNGMFLQIAEPPPEISTAMVEIPKPMKNSASLQLSGLLSQSKNNIKKESWQNIIDKHILSDPQAKAAFSGTKTGEYIFVKRSDKKNSDYFLVPFYRYKRGNKYLATAVAIIDASDKYFKEASWTKTAEKFLNVNKPDAINLVIKHIEKEAHNFKGKYFRVDFEKLIRYMHNAKTELLWRPFAYSTSPFKPYWKIDANGYIWYVTQEGKVISLKNVKNILKNIELNRIYMEKMLTKHAK